jgi:tetratricopeptide (TPR) repeat protein
MKCRAFVAALIVTLSLSVHSADAKEFVREYIYHAGETDSLISSRSIATEQIKRALLEELGTFLVSRTEVKDAKLTTDEIVSYTAGSVILIKIDERWNGSEYWMKAMISADPDQVARAILALKNNEEKADELKKLRADADRSMQEIERLKKELADLRKSGKEDAKKVAAIQKDYDRAVAGLSAEEINKKAFVLVRQKKYREAVEMLDEAIVASPTSSILYRTRTMIYTYYLKEYDKAVESATQAITVFPNEDSLYSSRCGTYNQMKQYDKALQDCRRAIELKPTILGYYTQTAYTLKLSKNYEAALDVLNQGLSVRPEQPALYHSRGQVYALMGQHRKAVDDFSKAIDMTVHADRAVTYLESRSISYDALGMHDEARADLEKAARQGYQPAIDRLTRMKRTSNIR